MVIGILSDHSQIRPLSALHQTPVVYGLLHDPVLVISMFPVCSAFAVRLQLEACGIHFILHRSAKPSDFINFSGWETLFEHYGLSSFNLLSKLENFVLKLNSLPSYTNLLFWFFSLSV